MFKILTFISSFLILFLLSIHYFSGDVWNHYVWGERLWEKGPIGFYSEQFHDFAFPNYPPVAMWLFAISYKIYQSSLDLAWNLNNLPIFPSSIIYFLEANNTKITFLKIPALISHIGIAYLIYLIIPLVKQNTSKKSRLLQTMIYFFNPAALYLTIIWGQIDLLSIFFLLLSIYLFFTRDKSQQDKYGFGNRIFFSFIFASFAILSKQTSILFWLIFMAFVFTKVKWQIFLTGIFLNVLVFYLMYFPFYNPSLIWPVNLYLSNFTYVAKITEVNSLNLWGFIYSYKGISDLVFYYSVTLQTWGYLIFFLLIIPIGIKFLIQKEKSLLFLLLTLSIAAMIYFFSLTRMHERYLIPTIVFFSLIFIKKKFYLVSLMFLSLIHLINLYRGLEMPDIPYVRQLVFQVDFLNTLVLVFSAIMLINLYLYVTFEEENSL